MTNPLYLPFDFSQITGYPHDAPEKAKDKLTFFQGNNSISAKSHIKAFASLLAIWAEQPHEDMKMKLFALSLEEDALDWFCELPNNS